MTYNQFKLLCIAYLKPFEGKPFKELVHAEENWSNNVNFNNLEFKQYINNSFAYVDGVSDMIIFVYNREHNFQIWNDSKFKFITIENPELKDII